MSPQWKRRIKIIAGIALALVALNAWISRSFSGLRLDHERHLRVVSDIRAFDCRVDSVRDTNGRYPTEISELSKDTKDPWAHSYIYRFPGRHHLDGYDIFSAGPDGKPDTSDDDWGD